MTMRLLMTVMALAALANTRTLADDLAKDFASPPPEARPWVYWFWINGNISKEGIMADVCYWFGEGAPLNVNEMTLEMPKSYDLDFCSSDVVRQAHPTSPTPEQSTFLAGTAAFVGAFDHSTPSAATSPPPEPLFRSPVGTAGPFRHASPPR